MNCNILHTLYIRADGSIPCDDDYGQGRILGEISFKSDWSIENIFLNDQYRHITNALINQTMPWPDLCSQCALLQAGPFSNGIQLKRLKKIQVEPSLQCTLLCPNCSRIAWIKKGMKPLLLNIKLYEKAIISLNDNDFYIENIEYCGQGEPLLHPEFSEFIRIGKLRCPQTPQQLFTNGNYSYINKIKNQHLDCIFVACDGLYQSSYEQYRINGSVALALKFMEEAKKYSPETEVIWKYILFEFNDSDLELKNAQYFAESIDIDRLLFILTPSNVKSKRFDIDNLDQFPFVSKKATIESHPYLTHIENEGIAVTPHDSRLLNGDVQSKISNYCVIDLIYTTKRPDKTLLIISGWAMRKNGRSLAEIHISIDEEQFTTCKNINNPRPDVANRYLEFSNNNTGFMLVLPRASYEKEVTIKIKMIS